jgi:hypothetical protein
MSRMPIVINMVCHGMHEPTNVNDSQLFDLKFVILLIIQVSSLIANKLSS